DSDTSSNGSTTGKNQSATTNKSSSNSKEATSSTTIKTDSATNKSNTNANASSSIATSTDDSTAISTTDSNSNSISRQPSRTPSSVAPSSNSNASNSIISPSNTNKHASSSQSNSKSDNSGNSNTISAQASAESDRISTLEKKNKQLEDDLANLKNKKREKKTNFANSDSDSDSDTDSDSDSDSDNGNSNRGKSYKKGFSSSPSADSLANNNQGIQTGTGMANEASLGQQGQVQNPVQGGGQQAQAVKSKSSAIAGANVTSTGKAASAAGTTNSAIAAKAGGVSFTTNNATHSVLDLKEQANIAKVCNIGDDFQVDEISAAATLGCISRLGGNTSIKLNTALESGKEVAIGNIVLQKNTNGKIVIAKKADNKKGNKNKAAVLTTKITPTSTSIGTNEKKEAKSVRYQKMREILENGVDEETVPLNNK
ncbi:MAG: hypothetical protein HQK51_12580, partial [Oligoflexia bacterium]|nr:hypothetical protein [Oligoflexia bacterium]